MGKIIRGMARNKKRIVNHWSDYLCHKSWARKIIPFLEKKYQDFCWAELHYEDRDYIQPSSVTSGGDNQVTAG